jgi:hypothetical protein
MFYFAPRISQMGIVNARRPPEFPPLLQGNRSASRLVRIKREMDFVIGKSSESGVTRLNKAQSRKEQGDQAQAAK